jgi:hypothetical protein
MHLVGAGTMHSLTGTEFMSSRAATKSEIESVKYYSIALIFGILKSFSLLHQ